MLPYFWVPEETLDLRVRRDHVPYDTWEMQGYLQTTEGNVVHYGYIEKFIEKLGERYNIFGNAFDLNHDGELDAFERASEFAFFSSIVEEEKKEEEHDELYVAGIDPEELEYMSGDERREILEDAGLDPDDYDF